MKELRIRSFVASILTIRKDWMPKVEAVPVEQITTQRIAKIIVDRRDEADEEARTNEEIFYKTFDITNVREKLHPEAMRNDFHKEHPAENQAVRIALRRLSIQGALREECPNSNKKPNVNGELYTYTVIDIKKLRETAKGTNVN